MKVALAQLDPLVGDIAGNTGKILAAVGEAKARGAELVVFSELAVIGYPPKDLLLKPKFVRDNVAAVERIARECRGIAAIVGFAQENEEPTGRHLRNSAALCADGRIVSVHHKSLLPPYDVFDEQRFFEPGPAIQVAAVPAARRPPGSACASARTSGTMRAFWAASCTTSAPCGR